MREMSTISPTKMVSLWWSVRWVRGLVLMLLPVGVVDAIYTLGMAVQYGPEVEFNPITRWFLANGLWHLWAIINITGYTFLCMLAGSYYLHTRNHPSGPDTLWLSLIISLRIGLTAYNVTFFYIPIIVTVYVPFWIGLMAFCSSLYFTNSLFRRQQDLSWRGATSFVSSKLESRYDARLIRDAAAGGPQNDDTDSKVPAPRFESNSSGLQEAGLLKGNFWIKRLAYFAGFLLSFVGMAVSINVLAILSGYTRWQYDIPTFTQQTGLIFIGSFVIILFFIGLSMYFLFKVFTIMQEGELPV